MLCNYRWTDEPGRPGRARRDEIQAPRSHTLLAQALAGDFTVYLPDRRGRGPSGPHRPDHSVRTEVDDLQAVLAESGTEMPFGVSSGGLVVLEAQ